MRKLSLLAAAVMVAGGSAFAMDGGGVSISGEANFGVKFKENDGGANAPNELQFHHEFDIKFSASGTTDGGIGFGGSMSIDNTESVSGSEVNAGDGAKQAKRLSLRRAGALALSETDTVTDDPESSIYVILNAEITTPTATGNALIVETNDKGEITGFSNDETATKGLGKNKYQLAVADNVVGNILYVEDGKLVVLKAADFAKDGSNWKLVNGDGTTGGDVLYKVAAGDGPMTAAGAAKLDPDASHKVDNHGEVYISMDMHKLTIGSDLDAADKLAGGLADPGFDGIGIDDRAEAVWGGSAADVRYDGDFGVASVAISYGDNKGDAEWAAGFSFNVEPVTFGAGFDSNGVMSVGMGFSQGAIAMNALYSTDSDHDEADNESVKKDDPGPNKAATGTSTNPARVAKPDLKNQAIGVDVTYQMSEATSILLVAAQHKKESADWYYNIAESGSTDYGDTDSTKWVTTSTTVDAFGVGFSHDLGGGATLKAGAGSVDSNAVADLGITMKF